MRVKPAPGVAVRDPDLKDFLPEDGREVPDTPYWNRLLHVFGDVTLVVPVAREEDKP
ncbi:DUF2635 domain-containing protein [Azospirillum cavernae]|jgi:hypothetical protein|uniref:DUF2635 domain-containing protein n=1 Tax=Azospirillum cavernae TaxID=2320860 RepID=A0A418VX16_9PROT|nr:DUF2635 domain-containing protein [Azospirillum cavernae]RJF81654.1 DUF2635 domain-containing protein [Azospirillum cavernae]